MHLQKKKKLYKRVHVTICFIYTEDSVEGYTMNIEVLERKFQHSLDQLAHSTSQLTNALVSKVVESSPQLYMKTKLHILSCIGALSQEVVELQQAWNELTFYRKKAGLASIEEESESLPKEKRSVKTADQPNTKRGRKKAVPEPVSIPVEIAVPLEERIQDPSPITTDTEKHL